jgi:hypothetical protein
MEPLTVVAMRGAQVQLTGVSAIVRSNSVPPGTATVPSRIPRASCARADLSQGDKLSSTPPAATP